MQHKEHNGHLVLSTATAPTIHRLSAELLVEIFETATVHFKFLCFSHVCGFWRRIIHGCSKFWSTIELQASSDDADQHAAYWLLRAGSSLLGDDAILVPLANVLRPAMDRCKQLSISASPPQLHGFFQTCAGHTPNLIELSIAIPQDFYDDESIGGRISPLYIPFTLPSNSEYLPRASIMFQGWFPIFSSFGASVTEPIVDGGASFSHTGDIMTMFASCPNLVKCSLSGYSELESGSRTVFHTVSLQHLVSLEMSSVPDVGNILEYLDLPSLKSLEVFDLLWDDAARRAFWRLFQSCPSLSKVSIARGDENISPDFSGPSLTLHSITYFRLDSNPVTYPLLQRLTLPNASSSPRAHTLSFSDITGSSDEPTIIPLPTLISLQIIGSIELLNYFHLPQLQYLHLDGESQSGDVARLEPMLLGLIERSAPSLVTLVLRQWRVSDQDLIPCLERLPHLEKFALHECTTTDVLLHALSMPSGPTNQGAASCLLPLLERFSFYKAGFTTTAFIAFLSF
ncbi:hypothetical protein BOTBODRAFT_66567 [Botryobasidium botryosum FD-172 SS1]|uniref:F-box domain-containing protein n=1 Tax=Botryobasidium botryosum (strain FD-172 SS1) TaxID=930990 RepID=A0A067MEC6_BOTB1|nr:hypothetical protein BOTBODRAFT_66567 [Botryobasidium botryosum FD-172 SS1]